MTDAAVKIIVFTDLDGTLLDRLTYDYSAALAALARLREAGIPLIFCSSKTRAEQEALRREIGVDTPFIVENGAAVFIARDYFTVALPRYRRDGDYHIIELGTPYAEVRRVLEKVRRESGLKFRGYADMTVAEVSAATGLDEAASRRAMRRDYEETVMLTGDAAENRRTLAAIGDAGLECAHGGRCYGVHRGGDKGRAAAILSGLYRQQFGDILTVGIGDSPNDLPMLAAVDRPFLVPGPDGAWADLTVPALKRVEGIGPLGFAAAVAEVLKDAAN